MMAESRYRLKPALLMLDDGDNLQVGFSPLCGIRVESPAPGVRVLLLALREGGTGTELFEAVKRTDSKTVWPTVAGWLNELLAHGLVEDVSREESDATGLPESYVTRHEHTLALLSLLTHPHTASAHAWLARLATTRIVLFGVGGVGCHVALSLVSAGCQRLLLIDSDRVGLSNLNRQTLYTPADVGRWKVEAAAEALRRFDPESRIDCVVQRIEKAEDLATFLPDDTGFLVCAADEPYGHIYRWVNAWACRLGVPWSAANFVEALATVGPLVVPRRTACWACMEAAMAQEGQDPSRFTRHMERQGLRFRKNPSLEPFVALASSILALDVIKTVTGMAVPTTWSRSLSFDLRDLTPRLIEWTQCPNCLVCGTARPAS